MTSLYSHFKACDLGAIPPPYRIHIRAVPGETPLSAPFVLIRVGFRSYHVAGCATDFGEAAQQAESKHAAAVDAACRDFAAIRYAEDEIQIRTNHEGRH